MTDIEVNKLNQVIEKGILRLIYEFVTSKNMTGINNINRTILPTADIFPTLTATSAKDHIAVVI
ncbi:hypothetical protein [Trichormus azollae]|jgi:DNA (cytosine-5)-methyltransferase 1|uniref:hypothetical protein n=1 Tax=Trichormus azollae TaxID=1164 RepID=UPI0001956C03|nr:hypothetical protein [Trichormus azollae]